MREEAQRQVEGNRLQEQAGGRASTKNCDGGTVTAGRGCQGFSYTLSDAHRPLTRKGTTAGEPVGNRCRPHQCGPPQTVPSVAANSVVCHDAHYATTQEAITRASQAMHRMQPLPIHAGSA